MSELSGDLSIPCPQCGTELTVTIGDLEKTLICPECALILDVQEVRDGLAEVAKGIDDLKKNP